MNFKNNNKKKYILYPIGPKSRLSYKKKKNRGHQAGNLSI